MKDSTSDTFTLMRATVRRRFPQLADDDLEFAPGEEEKLLQHVQRRTGESRETISILLRSVGVNIPPPWSARESGPTHNGDTAADLDHSRGSGIPDDTSRSGGRSM